MAYAAAYIFRVSGWCYKCIHIVIFQWYVLPWLRRGSPVVEQLGVVNSSLAELNNNLILNCKLVIYVLCIHVHFRVKLLGDAPPRNADMINYMLSPKYKYFPLQIARFIPNLQ